ncbi:MAG: MarR family transcriptional regulator [Desulfobacterales bacterium]
MKKSIKIEVGDAASTAKGFIDAWHRAEIGEGGKTEHLLMFENLETLLKTLTPGRWVLLKKLHQVGPASIRSLSKWLGRDYKNVYQDVKRLEGIGLVERAGDKITVPWDIVEARLNLAA